MGLDLRTMKLLRVLLMAGLRVSQQTFIFRALRVCQINGTNVLMLEEIILKNDSMCLLVTVC